MRTVEKTWNEFWAKHWRIDHRHSIPDIFEWDQKLVDFIEVTCNLRPGMKLLDLGCGGGDQVRLFAGKGYNITGIDIAPPLIEFARNQFREERLTGEFIIGDMREIGFVSEFDCCLILSGTFGFFGDDEDLALLRSIAKALRPRGKVFIMFLNAANPPKHSRTWRELDYGWELTETWFESDTSTHCGRVFIICDDGGMIKPKAEPGYHADETIRCYTVPEMKRMFSEAGLTYSAGYSSRNFSLPPQSAGQTEVCNIVVGSK